jgi:hypothetical protein
MSMDDDEIPAGVTKEHVDFMRQLAENVRLMLGDAGMVAVVGNEQNGVYGIMISVHQLPPGLVMVAIANMITDKLLLEMSERHNQVVQASEKSMSKFVN